MDKPTVYVGAEAWHKMLIYSKTTHDELGTEVGGMAEVYREDDKWMIKNPVILKQEVSGTNTHLDKEALAMYLAGTASQNKDAAIEGKLLFLWWHTHPEFGASMSGTDWDTIEEYSENGSGLALVINNSGDYQLIFSISDPVQAQVECDLQVLYDIDFNVKEEVEELCTKSTSAYVAKQYGYNSMYRSNWVDEGNQMNLLTDPKTEIVKNGNFDVDVDENGPFITHAEPMGYEEGSGLIDLKHFDIIDGATFEIDRALQQFENNEIIPDQVISVIEKVNGDLKSSDIKFMIPSPDEVVNISTAAELLEDRERYGLL